MLPVVKQFRVMELTVQGFKGFAETQSFSFSDMNVITGHMGVGKSSIADAIAFAVTGVSFFGAARIDALYHQGGRDLLVDMRYEMGDGTQHRLLRRRANDKMEVFLDERSIQQNELTALFGERDLFLSMFNPLYFIEVLEKKGRDLLERYLPDIPRETVLEELSEADKAILKDCAFPSADGYAKKVREEIAQLKRDAVYNQGQLDLLDTQEKERAASLSEKQAELARIERQAAELETKRSTGFDGADLKEKLAGLYARHEELLRGPSEAQDDQEDLNGRIQAVTAALEQRRAAVYQSKYADALSQRQAKIAMLRKEVVRQKHIVEGLRPGVKCPMCRQTVTEKNLPEVRKEFETSLRDLCEQGREQSGQMQELLGLDRKAKEVFEQFQKDDVAAGEKQLSALMAKREQAQTAEKRAAEQRTKEAAALRSEIQNVEMDLECGMLTPEETETLGRLREAEDTLRAQIAALSAGDTDAAGRREKMAQAVAAAEGQVKEKNAILFALSNYTARRVELSISSLQMNRVTISLYEVMKTTGEVRDVFKFNYEDRPYVCLSRSEKIRAGLEVAELVKRLAGVNYPVFIDNTESVPVIDNVRPTGQIFLAKVVKGTVLNVQASTMAQANQAPTGQAA